MKALLMKDCYVLWKQMRIFILILLVFCLFNGSFGSLFVVVWSAMMPYTAMAYDERSKWGQLAAMLPYADREIVLSKYCFGYLAIAVAAGISLVLQTVLTAVWDRAAENLSPLSSILLAICMGVGVLALTLPLMFRFGVEKGRLVMFLIIFLVCGGAGAVTGITSELSDSGHYLMTLALPGAALAAVILTAVSIPLSLRMYRRRA